MASAKLSVPGGRQTSIVVYPIDPSNTEQISETEASLGRVCGPQHVKSNQGEDGRMSWTLTLTDPKMATIIADHPHIRWDDPTTKKLLDYYWGEEANALPGVSYNVVASDKSNDAETKATRDFLEQKSLRPKDIIAFSAGTDHVIGWGNVRLDDAAKSEVESYPGVKPPLGVNWPVVEG